MLSARSMLTQIALVRTIYGVLSLFWPKAIFGPGGKYPPEADTRYFNALFGGRDLSIAAAMVVLAREGRVREAALLNVSCEATDVLAWVQEYRARGGVDSTVAAGIAFSGFGWFASARVIQALREGSGS